MNAALHWQLILNSVILIQTTRFESQWGSQTCFFSVSYPIYISAGGVVLPVSQTLFKRYADVQWQQHFALFVFVGMVQ
jgi:hypothetical protein